MKKIILIALAAFAVSCQNDAKKEEATFKGSINNVEDGTEVYLATIGDQGRPEPIDTVMVKAGDFTIDLPKVDGESLNILSFKGLRGNVVFINENEPITATVYKDSLRSSTVKGGES
ncbi:DUF4369 domain-containing protein, partial [Mesonia sp.]|uniref:DUF4369 domain-containing protein n=1 Tax=Mesonia sp. TaxID=1960830 RepID=UPI0025BAF220